MCYDQNLYRKSEPFSYHARNNTQGQLFRGLVGVMLQVLSKQKSAFVSHIHQLNARNRLFQVYQKINNGKLYVMHYCILYHIDLRSYSLVW